MKDECGNLDQRCGRGPQPCMQGLILGKERFQKRVFECDLYPKSEPFIAGGSLSTSAVCSSVAGGRKIAGGSGVAKKDSW